jgi:predicted dehydrogenase
VGHIERFNPAWLQLQAEAIEPKYVRAERLGPYTFRSTDIGVVFDLMIHDLDLILDVVRSPLRRVEAIGVSVFGRHEDIVNARLGFENGCVADVTASRVSFSASRQMQLWSAAGFAGLDFAQKRVTLVRGSEALRRLGTIDAAALPPDELAVLREQVFETYLERADLTPTGEEPLAAELAEFLTCCTTDARPRVGGSEACDAIALAGAVLDSLAVHQWDGHPAGPVGPFCLLPGEGIPAPHWQRESAHRPVPTAAHFSTGS